MFSRESFAKWYRNRFVWVAVILLTVSAGAAVLVNSGGSEAEPADLQTQIMNEMRSTLERSDPQQHNHGGHTAQQASTGPDQAPVICGVRVYGYEPATATTLDQVRTVYGFHLCGVAQPKYPWDVAVKLAGPVILNMATNPPGIQAVEATATTRYADRLREMFPPKYADLAQREALTKEEMADLRRRYDAAADL